MITNDRQYRITKAQADKFRQAIEDAAGYESELSPRMRQAVLDGMRSQLSDLEREIDEYDAIKNGERRDLAFASLAELPEMLILARIASHMTQAELAKRLGIHEQQIQRYEATSYAGASLTRLVETAEALGLSIEGSAHLPQPASTERAEALSTN
jgi:DNA-binding XRE family transcriptional regulator